MVLAALLTVSYTGKPAQLKYRALGDLVIFVMFGPMLMLFVVLAVTTTLSTSALALTLAHSVPVGLQTVAVLHANNARDAVEDKAAGMACALCLPLIVRVLFARLAIVFKRIYCSAIRQASAPWPWF